MAHTPYGCEYCRSEREPGWLEMDNNGPIVPCPFCNPKTARDIEYDRAEMQRNALARDGETK